MRHQTFLIMIFILCIVPSTYAQDTYNYRPFIEEGKVWKVGIYYGSAANDNPPHTTETYYFDGDTIINNTVCKKWKCLSEGQYGTGDNLVACIYEVERRVWYFAPTSSVPMLLYDFSVLKGEKIDVSSPIVEQTTCLITDVVETTRNGHELTCVCFADEIDVQYPNEVTQSNSFWMEGIGTTCSPVMNARLNIPGRYSILLECHINQQILYSRRDNPADYLNDIDAFQISDAIMSLPFVSINQPSTVFDLSGRPLSTPPAKGIYIRDGKKVVVR